MQHCLVTFSYGNPYTPALYASVEVRLTCYNESEWDTSKNTNYTHICTLPALCF